MTANEQKVKRTEWFRKDRFGMFIHFGLYAITARSEWIKSVERIDDEQYDRYFREFDPVDYDPKQWAALAKKAGMKYAVLTSKHHDGFCLFDSKYTDYKCTMTGHRRDIVREFLDAFRAEGLKVGLYYSLLDWHHPDYPIDEHHPLRDCDAAKQQRRDHTKYIEYMHNQVEELVSGYGKIDIMWFDFSYGEKRGEYWQAERLVKMIRSYQPDIIIDNRLGAHYEDNFAGDFLSPEQMIPKGRKYFSDGTEAPWELCVTLNNNWGYDSYDVNYKSADDVTKLLVECVSKNGNMLLDVGPNARGSIPSGCVEILNQIGEFMEQNGESIYGCGASEFEKPEWGFFTKKQNNLYAHVFNPTTGFIPFSIDPERVDGARLLYDGCELSTSVPWNIEHYGADGEKYIFVNDIRKVRPDLAKKFHIVIKLKLK